jgi:geranylgeranyl diphosphate synthase type I
VGSIRSFQAPASLRAIGERCAARIDRLLAAEEERWQAVDPVLAEPVASLRTLIASGGKRLRPAFCHWGYVAAGGSPDDDLVVDAGAALELLHSSALVHDDIMDGGSRRHGLPCVHVDYAERHRARTWRGESRRFGDGVAILIGDLAFVYADLLLRGAPPAALDVFTELRLELNAGQLLDLESTAAGSASVERARLVCVYKSGKYTVERPLHLGAALAGGLDELAKPFTSFGVPLGEAFQLRDDLLGAFGDDRLLGTGVGDDFREGKPTALYAIALERAAGIDADLLRDRFGRADLTETDVASIQEVLERTGGRAAVEATIDTLVAEATAALAGAPIAAEARGELLTLARFVAGRDH